MNKIREKLTILIPCYNEERGIGKVIDRIPHGELNRYGLDVDVIVIDNNSTDQTTERIKDKKVRILFVKQRGKGFALRAGFDAISRDTSYIVMLDGDNTYDAKEIIRMVEPLKNNFCNVVIGSRLGGKITRNSLKFSNRVANWAYTFLVRQFYGANVTDVLSGYYAWKSKVIFNLKDYLESDGFGIEMEMITKMRKLGYKVYSVPITYREREGQTKIESLKDGAIVLHMFFKNLFWDKNVVKKTTASFSLTSKFVK